MKTNTIGQEIVYAHDYATNMRSELAYLIANEQQKLEQRKAANANNLPGIYSQTRTHTLSVTSSFPAKPYVWKTKVMSLSDDPDTDSDS